MNTYISMLRGINVGKQNQIRMANLRDMYESMEFENVQSYLQSGNVVFDTDKQYTEGLANAIEARLEETFFFSVPVLIRTAADFRRIIKNHPFKDEQPVRVLVTFLYERPEPAKLEELRRYEDTTDRFAIGEQEIFLFCPGGYGRTKLSNAFFEKKLGVVATTRNWKSVNALYEMARVG